jgi:hypothetical protein
MSARNDTRLGQEDDMNDAAHDAVLAASLPPGASPQLKAALQQFMDDFSQHSRKSSELLDVLIQALKTVNQELQQQKLKTHLLETRLKKAESQAEEVTRVVGAFRRQGWVQ